MRLDFCAVCGSTEDLQHHHFTPRIEGGIDDETNIITLCYEHHCEIHGQSYRNRINHVELVKKGMREAKERGVKFGNPKLAELNKTRKHKARIFAYEHAELIKNLRSEQKTYRQICELLNSSGIKTRTGKMFHPAQIHRILKRSEFK